MTVNCFITPMEEKLLTIQDLCELTGYSRRTVRYYVQEGLLDPPAGRGRGGFYFDSHLEKLLKIKALQDKGLRLSAILEVLNKGGKIEPPAAREVWIKYPIDQGIEIHISRDLEERERKKVAEIVKLAKSIITSGGNSNG